MNKRSAMMVAAGLVLAMLVAGMAVAAGFTGPEASASDSRTTTGELEPREPKVRTVTETVTIHRTAKASDDATLAPVVVTPTPTSPSTSEGLDDDEDGYEDEVEDEVEHEDGYEHEVEHEDD